MTSTWPEVTNKIVDKVNTTVTALAAKLGVAAHEIFGWYYRQAYVESIRDALMALLFWFACGLCWHYCAKAGKKADWSDLDQYGSLSLALAIAAVICALVATTWSYDAIGPAINPGYWAFHHILIDLRNYK